MPIEERTIYWSENGDRWSLAHDLEAGALFVRHQANLPSGGHASDIALGEFLMQGGRGPETQELLHLIAGLVRDQQDTGSAGQTANGQTPRGAAGLVASHDEDLA